MGGSTESSRTSDQSLDVDVDVVVDGGGDGDGDEFAQQGALGGR
jgi:hypothetical protein